MFSEDKRTDLIGECWISLDAILIPGGGKNDLWHNLNYKGRNAGEIRVELTFYDSRPREIRQEEITAMRESQSTRSVKRRPLPADPTSSGSSTSPASWHGPRPLLSLNSQSSPAITTRNQDISKPRQEVELYQPPVVPQPRNVEAPYERPQSEIGYGSHSDIGIGARDQALTNYQPFVSDEYEEPDFSYNGSAVSAPAAYGEIELPELPPHTPRTHRSSNAITPKYYSPVNSSPSYTLPQYDRTPEAQIPLSRERLGSTSVQRNDPYRSSPLRSRSTDEAVQPYPQQYPDQLQRHHSVEDQTRYDDQFISTPVPPPPPTPQHSRGRSIPQGQLSLSHYQPDYAPPPLNIRRSAFDLAARPLGREYHPQADQPGISAFEYRSLTAAAAASSSAPVTANHTPITQRSNPYDRRGSAEPERVPRNAAYATPQSQRPQSYTPQSRGSPYGIDYRQNHHLSNSFDMGHDSYGYEDPVNSTQQYAHREDAPIAKPRAISPDVRATSRKSVSPRPSMASDQPGLRGSAFSPDSFDQFNPNMGSSKPTSLVGTPESVRGNSRGHELPPKVEREPIIGSDGRVIDPSDHLPSDTWAPEPEKKSARKSHQINVKFRHTPQSQPRSQTAPSRPLPQVSTRPVSMVPSVLQPMALQYQNYPADDTMSQASNNNSGGRNRLQKRPPSHVNSSPNSPLPQQQQQQQHRTPPSSQPLREHQKYGYNNSSPSYGRHSMSGPPPIPAKIPHGMDQEDWPRHDDRHRVSFNDNSHHQEQAAPYPNHNNNNNHNHNHNHDQQYQAYSIPQQQQHQQPATISLSDEMSRIDLGAGGNGRGRRGGPIRYGAY